MSTNERMGRTAPALALAGLAAMVAMLAYGFHQGYLLAEGSAIASVTWGQVLIADIYVGIALFSGWIAWREAGRPGRAAAWIAALVVLGNIVACLYVLLAWYRSGGHAAAFWHGRRA